jgi:hypothetical protein
MEFVYIFLYDNFDWEDIIVFLSEEEAIQKSVKVPNARLEIFKKSENGGYIPTHHYYKKGKLY